MKPRHYTDPGLSVEETLRAYRLHRLGELHPDVFGHAVPDMEVRAAYFEWDRRHHGIYDAGHPRHPGHGVRST